MGNRRKIKQSHQAHSTCKRGESDSVRESKFGD